MRQQPVCYPIIVLLLCLVLSLSAWAEKRLIADAEPAPLLQTPAGDTVITELLPQTAVDVYGTDMASGYAYVKTLENQYGWVALTHLNDTPIAPPDTSPPAITNLPALPDNPFARLHSWLRLRWQQQWDPKPQTDKPYWYPRNGEEFVAFKTIEQLQLAKTQRSQFLAGVATLLFGFLLGLLFGQQRSKNKQRLMD